MRRRKKFKFIPVDRCLHPADNVAVASDRHNRSSLPEKLGLKTISKQKSPLSKPDPFIRWLDLPRFPQWHPEHPVARIIVMATRNNHPMTFRYHAGSTPGAKRTIYPAEVFTVGWGDALYVSGWCMNKEAHRTFRIDRIDLVG